MTGDSAAIFGMLTVAVADRDVLRVIMLLCREHRAAYGDAVVRLGSARIT